MTAHALFLEDSGQAADTPRELPVSEGAAAADDSGPGAMDP